MSLRTTTKKSHKKSLIITTIVVIVLLGGYTAYAATSNTWPFSTSKNVKAPNTTNNNENLNPNTKKQDNQTTDQKNNSTATNKTPPQSSPPKSGGTPSTGELTGVVNYKQVSNGSLVIRNTINQQIPSGTCTLTLTNTSGTIVTRTADIVADPSSSTCKGFSVPTSELGSGVWTIEIKLTSGDKSGMIRSSITI